LVGFGIKDKTTFDAVKDHAHGAIIGSAFIKALSEKGTPSDITSRFINAVLN
jgi:tryptophan synthase alpha chain